MPELPEVETTKNGVAPLIIGKTIKDIRLHAKQLRTPLNKKDFAPFIGTQFTSVVRRAKYLLLHSSISNHAIVIHLGMSGSLRVNPATSKRQKHDHVSLFFTDNTVLRLHDPRRFGMCQPITLHPLPRFLAQLGVEPLSPDFNLSYLYPLAQRRKAAIKSLIMDQKIVVGIGNIYATEALFRANIAPFAPCHTLSKKRLERLIAHCKAVLEEGIQQGGTTLKDFTHVDGKAGYFQQTLAVYARANQPCVHCGTRIQSMIIAGRNSAFCPHCQPL